MLTIYHNPSCSKSREALALLNEQPEPVQVVEYLKTQPSVQELREVLHKLQMRPEQIVRKGEPMYKEQFEGKELTDEEWLQILSQHPVLIERPIVIKGDRAALGRPMDNVQQLLEEQKG